MGNRVYKAAGLLTGNRMKKYGDPLPNYERAANIAFAITGKDFSARDVLWTMVSVKLAREAHRHGEDNLVDAVGYLDIIQVQAERTTN